MDRILKINKLKELEGAIKEKQKQIRQDEIELEKLKKQYDIENVSQLPILLFMINTTLPMPDDEDDWKYKYIYYCPDLDNIKCIERNRKNDFLQNTVDLREQFEDFDVPKKCWIGNCYYENQDAIMQAVSILKSNIDEIFNSRNIDSWSDLGVILTNEFIKNGHSKVLKPNTTTKCI